MLTKPLAFIVLAAACVTAAAGGAYMALRDNRSGSGSEAGLLEPATAGESTLPAASEGVEATEAIVAEPDPKVAAPEPVAAPPAPAPKTTLTRERPAPRGASPSRPSRTGPAAVDRESTSSRRAPVPTREPVQAPPRSSPPAWTPREPAAEPPIDVAERPVREPEPLPPPPPAPVYEELVVSADAVIGLQIETAVSTETAKVEDRVDARVTRDVKVGDRVAIPAGSRVVGSITSVEKGGKVKERARLGVRFHTVVLADGSEQPIRTEPVYRDGASPAGESAAKIGGAAIGGAILGAIMGGGKGAAIGGSVGAAGGTAAVLAGGRNAATLPAGSVVTVRLTDPITISVEK